MNRLQHLVLTLLAALLVPAVATAQQDPTIIPVPFAQENPALPHPAHEQAPITLKAILRNANCAQGYNVWWDVNRNGNFDDDGLPRLVHHSAGTVYDIGRTFAVPDVARDTNMPIGVRVRNLCTQADAFSTFRLFVYDFVANADPRLWTADQFAIILQVSVGESLWWVHRQTTGRGGAGAQISGRYGSSYVAANGLWHLGHDHQRSPARVPAQHRRRLRPGPARRLGRQERRALAQRPLRRDGHPLHQRHHQRRHRLHRHPGRRRGQPLRLQRQPGADPLHAHRRQRHSQGMYTGGSSPPATTATSTRTA